MVQQARRREVLTVVEDQIGSPTFTKDLVQQISALLGCGAYGLYHTAGLGAVSRLQWAQKILDLTGLSKQCRLEPITSAQLAQLARRPANSVLDNLALRLEGLNRLRPWEEGLEEYFS